jgi:hypothetical protein
MLMIQSFLSTTYFDRCNQKGDARKNGAKILAGFRAREHVRVHCMLKQALIATSHLHDAFPKINHKRVAALMHVMSILALHKIRSRV